MTPDADPVVSWQLLTLMGTVALAAAGGTWWLAGTLRGVGSRMEKKLEGAIEAMKAHVTEKVGALRMEIETSRVEQALHAAMLNPGFRVPDPRDPTKVITVHVEDIECDEDRRGGRGRG